MSFHSLQRNKLSFSRPLSRTITLSSTLLVLKQSKPGMEEATKSADSCSSLAELWQVPPRHGAFIGKLWGHARAIGSFLGAASRSGFDGPDRDGSSGGTLYHRCPGIPAQLPRGFPRDPGTAREAAACSDPTAGNCSAAEKKNTSFAFSTVRPGLENWCGDGDGGMLS
jgi:hypothetical protein